MSDLDANSARTDSAGTGSALDRLEHLGAPTTSRQRSWSGTSTRPNAPVAAQDLTRSGRVSRWDRPKPPMDWRWWVGNVGKVLIAAGLLMFGFVAYQLWGTGIETARAQNQLENEFDSLLAEPPAATAPDFAQVQGGSIDPDPPTAASPSDTEAIDPPVDDATQQPATAAITLPPVPVEEQNIPELENGDALARLEIPRIGRNDIVVAGVRTSDLKRGPGHFPDTPLPGQLGNSAIAGHRTTYGAPFFNVDQLEIGDDIIATTLNGRYTYRVTGQQIVASDEYWVVATADSSLATLTLTSCHPKYTAQQRIVVFSELVASESAAVGEPVLNYGRASEPDGTDTSAGALPDEDTADAATAEEAATTRQVTGGDIIMVDGSNVLAVGDVSDEIVDAFSDGWFSDPGANGQVALWGTLLTLVSVGAYMISRRLRRVWAGALIGIVPFVVALYFFYQNVNRLLPPNL